MSVATALGVYAAYRIVEDVLVYQALQGEAAHFWQLRNDNPNQSLPDTANMKGYLALVDDTGAVLTPWSTPLPTELVPLAPGFDRQALHGQQPLILVSDHANERLYLVFKEEQVSRLALFFGVAPLTIVLVIIYLGSWFTFRQSQRLISPIVQMATVVEQSGTHEPNTLVEAMRPFHKVDDDIDTLARAIESFAARAHSVVDRERRFSRDASHELRTPLAVLKGSLDVLDQLDNANPRTERVYTRMRKTVGEMESLIETLLLLTREAQQPADIEIIALHELLPQLAHQQHQAVAADRLSVQIDCEQPLTVKASRRVVTIIFSNLIRNALLHGHQSPIRIRTRANTAIIEDEGPGIDAETLATLFEPFQRGDSPASGYGLGLTIVKQLCDRFQWPLSVHSVPGEGTRFTVQFPDE